MSVDERTPLAPVPGLRRQVLIPPPPRRAGASGSETLGQPKETADEGPPTGHLSPTDTVDASVDTEGAAAGGIAPTTSVERGRSSRRRNDSAPDTQTQPRRGSGPGKASETAEVFRPVTLSLPAEVVSRLKERALADRVSQPEVLLDALTAAEGELEVLLRSARPRPTKAGLFLRTPRSGPAEPMATLSMRLLERNLAVIDDLVIAHEAASRSALCAAALRSYLSV